MAINENITIKHSINANAAGTMAAERIQNWVDDGNGIAPDAVDTRIVCNRKGEGRKIHATMADGSNLVMTLKNNRTTSITATA